MNRQEIREAISCPQFGDTNYGKWGMLRFEQRKVIKELLEELDNADFCIQKLHFKIDKAIEYIKEKSCYDEETKMCCDELYDNEIIKLLEILGDKEIEEIPQFKGTLEALDNLTLGGNNE